MRTHQMDTGLDLDWLKSVAGMDDAEIARWDMRAWGEWSRAMHADRHGPNPAVPAWMRPLLDTWHVDFSLPFPCVAQLWPTGHDWFAETDAHPDLTLTVEAPVDAPAPTLEQVLRAWEHTAGQGATPLMMICVVPADPWGAAVTGQIEAFYTVTDDPLTELAGDVARILGIPGATTAAAFKDATQLRQLAGLKPAGHAAGLCAWEWMY